MSKTTLYIIAALGALLLMRRAKAAEAAPGTLARVGGLAETGVVDGTNWTGNLWSTLQDAADFKDPFAPNLNNGANASPSAAGTAQLGIAPGWDGSL